MARGDGLLPHIALTGDAVDRCAQERTDPALFDRLLADPHTAVLELIDGGVPVEGRHGARRLRWRTPVAGDRDRLWIFLGRDDSTDHPAYLGVVVDGGEAADRDMDPGERSTLRSVGAELPDKEARLLATAQALANWHRMHTHCPRCGAPTVVIDAGWVRRCTADASEHYPRTDPAVIMAVIDDDDRLLLAGAVGFTATGMSVLAGFVEPGETMADAVRREVREEVGVQVGDVSQLADQPWPFPTGLMIGFVARALTQELTLQDEEIRSARWFTRAELDRALAEGSVHIPGRISISRRLIEYWYGGPIDVPDVNLRR